MTRPITAPVSADHARPEAEPLTGGARRLGSPRPVRALAWVLALAIALGTPASDTASGTPFTGEVTITLAADPVVYPSASVTYLHYQTWTADFGVVGTVMTTYDEQIWWSPDGTALTKRCGRSEPAGSIRIAHPEPVTGPCPQTARYGAGGFTAATVGQLGTDPETMRRQLARYETGSGDQDVLRAVAALYRYHHLNPQQRAAVVEVLADVPSVKYHGEATDRAGRKGLAFSVESGDDYTGRIRDVIILDGASGVLLDYEQIALTPPAGQSLIKANSVTAYVVYLDSRMVTTIPGTPSATCDQTRCITNPQPNTTPSSPSGQDPSRLAARGAVAPWTAHT